MAAKPKTADELIAGGAFAMPKLSVGTQVILESACDTLYEIRVINPVTGLVEFFSSAPAVVDNPTRQATFLGAWSDLKGSVQIPDCIVRNCRALLKFTNEINFITEPIVSATLYGAGWDYEVFNR